MDNPFFTVIIPTYNRADLIGRPIESVQAQTFPSWELIIVDDGSTDNTGQVVKSYTDSRIHYIFQPRQERSAARNTGIEHARGQYICFLDSDDYYLPQHLESFYKKIEQENFPVAVLYCDTYEDLNGRLLRHETPSVEARNAVEWVVQVTLGAPRTCVHRAVLEKHKFNPAVTVSEDVDLWVRALKEFPLIYHQACTVVFVSHEGRTVGIGNESSFKAHIAVAKRIFSEDAGGFISRKVQKQVLSRLWFRLAQHYIHVNRKRQAVFSLLHSLVIDIHSGKKEKIYLLLQQFFLARQLLSIYTSSRQKQITLP